MKTVRSINLSILISLKSLKLELVKNVGISF